MRSPAQAGLFLSGAGESGEAAALFGPGQQDRRSSEPCDFSISAFQPFSISLSFAAMKVDVRKSDDVIIVDFEGRLVLGDGDEVLAAVVDELLAEDYRKILLNLGNVEYIDSNGLGELVQSLKLAQRFGATMKLLRPQDRVRKTLTLTKMLPLFEVYESEEDAVASFN